MYPTNHEFEPIQDIHRLYWDPDFLNHVKDNQIGINPEALKIFFHNIELNQNYIQNNPELTSALIELIPPGAELSAIAGRIALLITPQTFSSSPSFSGRGSPDSAYSDREYSDSNPERTDSSSQNSGFPRYSPEDVVLLSNHFDEHQYNPDVARIFQNIEEVKDLFGKGFKADAAFIRNAIFSTSDGEILRLVMNNGKEFLNTPIINRETQTTMSLLHYALFKNNQNAFSILIHLGADLSIHTVERPDAFLAAAVMGKGEVVVDTLRWYFDISPECVCMGKFTNPASSEYMGPTPAAFLADLVAILNEKNFFGHTPLDYDPESAHHFLQLAADLEVFANPDNPQGIEHLFSDRFSHYAAATAEPTGIPEAATEPAGGVNQLGVDGYTRLHQAILGKNRAAVERLIQEGASLSIRTGDGRSSLQLAIDNGSVGVFEAILTHAPGNLQEEDVIRAIDLDRGRMIKEMVEKKLIGPDTPLNTLREDPARNVVVGQQAIHYAINTNRRKVVEALGGEPSANPTAEETSVSGEMSYRDAFPVLGLKEDELPKTKEAALAVVKKAYRKLVVTLHPDKNTDKSERGQEKAQEEFTKLGIAYNKLMSSIGFWRE